VLYRTTFLYYILLKEENINMKILCIADLHIGRRQNIKKYYENEMLLIIKTIDEEDIDVIVICGDLYDKRIFVNSEFNEYANLFINNLAIRANKLNKLLIILKGTISHDYNQISSFNYLSSPNVKIVNTTEEIFYNNSKFLIIPEEYEHDKNEYYKNTIYNKDKFYDFVFGHGMFTFAGGYATESNKTNHIVFDPSDFENNVYGSVIFGHIHVRMRKKNCQYVGSFSRDSFGEEEPKGVLMIEYDEIKRKIIKETFIENKNAPKLNTFNAKDIHEDKVFEDIEKLFKTSDKVRIVIDSDITETKFNNLKAITYDNNNLLLYKRMRGLSKKDDETKNIELSEKRSARKSLLDKYSNMNFFDLTKTIAIDKYKTEFSTDEIKEAIA